YTRWHVATTTLPKSSSLRLRFVVKTDPAVTREGIAIDDIHVYDLEQSIYEGSSLATPVTAAVRGNGFVHFEILGQRIASINSNGQNLGATKVQAYIFTDSVRSQKGQYYHNRNLTIQPAETDLKDSVTVRFYFLDAETDSLLLATNCAGCRKPTSAYALGVTKYSDADALFENGTLRDNQQGIWQFIAPQQVTIVPYDKGYYAEFKVMDFSEFWLNAGALSGTGVLPLKLLHFSAQKTGVNDVQLQWQTAAEDKVVAFDIELARGSADVEQNRYETIGTEVAKGGPSEQQYTFTDKENFKAGTRYYRLKIKNEDGSFSYSPVRSVTFNDAALWQVFPNPSSGVFNLVYRSDAGSALQVQVTDLAGRILKTISLQAAGYLQKQEINLTTQPAGIYLLKVKHAGGTELYKLYRQ
ncbi:MAG: T9SS type A sorting domain-containing protein, partial [Chitinophagaceae bacterium]